MCLLCIYVENVKKKNLKKKSDYMKIWLLHIIDNKMKNQTKYTLGTVLNSNGKIVETEYKLKPPTHK